MPLVQAWPNGREHIHKMIKGMSLEDLEKKVVSILDNGDSSLTVDIQGISHKDYSTLKDKFSERYEVLGTVDPFKTDGNGARAYAVQIRRRS